MAGKDVSMKPQILTAIVVLAAGVMATPGFAQPFAAQPGPSGLNHVVGDTVLGTANAELGVVSAVAPHAGFITLIGRHGEVANISASLLRRDGFLLRAPSLTAADVKVASDANLTMPGVILTGPSVTVVEPPVG
jgi:hypothetical protein